MRTVNPYLLDLPAAVAFSGGRTSGYMLHHILQAHREAGEPIPYVVFTNTGKERPETLDFVRDCERAWHVPVVWLEYRYAPDAGPKHTFVQVDYASASRCGEPFDAIIGARSFLPNRIARYCTAELKVRTMWRWASLTPALADGYVKAIGLRHDEPGRCERIMQHAGRETRAAEEIALPLNEARVSLEDVTAFWKAQPFDLQLMPHEGNCDLCFLKRKGAILEIMERRPDLADWWIRAVKGGARFPTKADRPRYELLLAQAGEPSLFDDVDDDLENDIPCACTD